MYRDRERRNWYKDKDGRVPTDLVRPAFLGADNGESDDGTNDDKSDEGHTDIESSPPTRAEISRFLHRADGLD